MSLAATNRLREVRLYGPLRAQFGRSHWLAVESPAEALRALCTQQPGFRAALASHRGPGYRVLVGEGTGARFHSAETLEVAAGAAGAIRIVPVIRGGKSRNWGYVWLIAAAVLYAYGGGTGSRYAATVGIGLLSQPRRPRRGQQPGELTSYAFSGAVNVAEPGGCVPLLIGRMFAGSVVVSAGLATDELSPVQEPSLPELALPAYEARDPVAENGSPGG